MNQVSVLPLFEFALAKYLIPSYVIVACSILWVLYKIFPSWLYTPAIQLIKPQEPALTGDTDIGSFVQDKVPSLKQGFKPSWWLPNGHAQTIYSAMADFSQDDPVNYDRKLLKLPDGGTIGIDIFPPLSTDLSPEAPVVILNHGLTGGSHESYVRNMVVEITKPFAEGGLGGRVAVVNFRGCAATPITSPHLYSSGTTLDTHIATIYLKSLFSRAPLFGIGFSLGAAVMTRYLGEQGDNSLLRAACVLCAPLELTQMSKKLDERRLFPKLYSYSMARKMIRSLLPHLSLPDAPLSCPTSPLHPHLPALLSMAGRYRFTLRASHVMEVVAAKVGGSSEHFPFTGLKPFLEWACPGAWLGRIKRPTLAISAIDDPIVSGECLPFDTVRASSHFVLAAVPYGGHLGWFDGPISGPNRHHRWHTAPVVEFLRAAMELPWTELPHVASEQDKEQWSWAGCIGWQVVS